VGEKQEDPRSVQNQAGHQDNLEFDIIVDIDMRLNTTRYEKVCFLVPLRCSLAMLRGEVW
jgi:hypothetical protein